MYDNNNKYTFDDKKGSSNNAIDAEQRLEDAGESGDTLLCRFELDLTQFVSIEENRKFGTVKMAILESDM